MDSLDSGGADAPAPHDGEVLLAGGIAVRSGHQAFVPRSGGAQTALTIAMLVLERARGVSPADLAEELWPGREPTPSSLSHVRTLVSRARRPLVEAFGEHVLPDRNATGGRWVLRLPPGVTVDVERVGAEAARGRRLLDEGDAAGARAAAEAALSTATGAFLTGIDGEWAAARRERHARAVAAAHEVRAAAALDAGEVAAAIDAATEAIARDPTDEAAYRTLIAAHARAGNRAAAETAYSRLSWALTQQGHRMSPETVAAYHALYPAEGARPRPGRDGGDGGGSATRPATPFVGRVDEMGVLDEAWEHAMRSGCHLVLVTGEAGIGKTRLALEASFRIAERGGRRLFGRCDRERTVRYQPLAEALGPVVSTAPADELGLTGARRAELAAVVPGLDDSGPSGPVEQARLFDTVAGVVATLADNQPLVLVLDDLQWADRDTLVLVRHVVRTARRAPVLVIATVRDHDLPPGHPLDTVLRPLLNEGWARRLPLGGLDEDEVVDLAHAMGAGAGVAGGAPAVARRVATDTGGNPFFLVHLLDPDRPADQPVPDSVHDLLAERLARLDDDTVKLLRAGAVIGTSFELGVAAAVAGLDEDVALDAVDAALASGLVVEAGDRYRFGHDITRRALEERLTIARRQALHRRAAEAIEARYGHTDAQLGALAHHADLGATPGGDPRAVLLARRAARQAMTVGADAEAARLLRQARAHLPPDDEALAAEVLVELGVALLRCDAADAAEGDAAEGEAALVEGATRARGARRLGTAARAALALADRAVAAPGTSERALALVDLILDTPAPDDPTAARLLVRRAQLTGEPLAAPPAGAVTALSRVVEATDGLSRLDERCAMADDLAALAAAGDDATGRAVAAHARATVAALRADEKEVDAALAQLAALAALTDLPPAGAGGPAAEATAPDHRRLDEERRRQAVGRLARRSSAVASRAGDFPAVDAAGEADPGQRLVVAWMRGTLADDPGAAGAARDPAEQALVAAVRGESDRARLLLRGIVLGVDRLPDGDAWLHAAGVAALAAAHLEEPELAERVGDLLAPHRDLVCGRGYETFVGAATYHLGCLAAVGRHWGTAARHLNAAMRLHADLGAIAWVALAQHALAGVLDRRNLYGDRDDVRMLEEEASRTAARLHMRPLGRRPRR